MRQLLHTIFLLLMFGLPALAWAQAPYNGGKGDGYDSHSFTVLRGDPGLTDPFTVSPTVFQSGDPILIQVAEVQERLRIRIYSVDGKLIRTLVDERYLGRYYQYHLLEELASASYILEVIADEEKFTQKLLIYTP